MLRILFLLLVFVFVVVIVVDFLSFKSLGQFASFDNNNSIKYMHTSTCIHA